MACSKMQTDFAGVIGIVDLEPIELSLNLQQTKHAQTASMRMAV